MGLIFPKGTGIFEEQLLWALLNTDPSRVEIEKKKMEEESKMSLDWSQWQNQFTLIRRVVE